MSTVLELPTAAYSVAQNIPLALIKPSSTNREATVDADFIESIRQHGVIQPIVLRPVLATLSDVTRLPVVDRPFQLGETIYEIVSGERRFLGSKAAKKTSIPAVVRILTDAEAMELQIIENDQREDLSPLDRAQAYTRLRSQYLELHKGERGYTETMAVEEVAKKVSREVRTVYQVIQLGKLAWELQNALRQKEMEVSHAYEICRRSEEEQLELLKWLRDETAHSKGDVPSVRRLKAKIKLVEIAADEKRRQEKLFKDATREGEPEVSHSSVTSNGEGKVSSGKGSPLKKPAVPSPIALTSAPGTTISARAAYSPQPQKVPTRDELKKAEQIREVERQAQQRHQANFEVNQRVENKFNAMFFAAFASKAKISSRFLTHLVAEMMIDAWECEIEIGLFAQSSLGWPAPGSGTRYSRDEVKAFSRKHTRKYTPGLFAALAAILSLTSPDSERLARYNGVDPKKLRIKATAAVKAEDAKAKLQTSAAPLHAMPKKKGARV